MPFQSPVLLPEASTDLRIWEDIKDKEVLLLQAVKSTHLFYYEYRYRILLILLGNRYMIATASNKRDIEKLWFTSLHFVEAIGKDQLSLSAFSLLYLNSREFPTIIINECTQQYSTTENTEIESIYLSNGSFSSEYSALSIRKQRARSRSCIFPSELARSFGNQRDKINNELNSNGNNNNNNSNDDDNNNISAKINVNKKIKKDNKKRERNKKEVKEGSGQRLVELYVGGEYQSLLLLVEDYTTNKRSNEISYSNNNEIYTNQQNKKQPSSSSSSSSSSNEQQVRENRTMTKSIRLVKPEITSITPHRNQNNNNNNINNSIMINSGEGEEGGYDRSLFTSFSLSKKEKKKIQKLFSFLQQRSFKSWEVSGKPKIVKAMRDHPRDHWAKLGFQKGDIFIAFPNAITGDAAWCLGISEDFEERLFYRFGYVVSIDGLVDHHIEYFNRQNEEKNGLHDNKKRSSPLLRDEMMDEYEQSEMDSSDNLSGWLWKKGNWGIWKKDWKKRYFLFDAKRMKIFYYAEPKLNPQHHRLSTLYPTESSSSSSSPKREKNNANVERKDEMNGSIQDMRGYINVRDITTIHESYYPGMRKKKTTLWTFEIHTMDRVWMLAASSELQMIAWIDKITSILLNGCIFQSSEMNDSNSDLQSQQQNINVDISLNLNDNNIMHENENNNNNEHEISPLSSPKHQSSNNNNNNNNSNINTNNNNNNNTDATDRNLIKINTRDKIENQININKNLLRSPQGKHHDDTEYHLRIVTSSPGTTQDQDLTTTDPTSDWNISSYNLENNFDLFGAPHGEEIINKYSILKELDDRLGYGYPPAIEYIFVEPYLNYSSPSLQLSANPYGHAVLRYTLPTTGEQFIMNIVGLANQEMVNFLPPEEYLFSTNFDIKLGNEQGSIYNRNFASVRIQRVPPEKVLAMHQFFADLKTRSHNEKALYNIAVGPILNLIGKTTYGNCAYYCSQGLRFAGVLKVKGVGSMLPKAIWVDLYEELVVKNQHHKLSRNVSIVYYKRIQHAKRFYGLDEDYTGWGRPSESFNYGSKYNNLSQFADAIVFVPPSSKRAHILTPFSSTAPSFTPTLSEPLPQSESQSDLQSPLSPKESTSPRSSTALSFTLNPKEVLDGHIKPCVLYNEYFMKRIYLKTLKSLPPPSIPFISPTRSNSSPSLSSSLSYMKMMSFSSPLSNNFWYIKSSSPSSSSPSDRLFKSFRTSSHTSHGWVEVTLPHSLLSSSSPSSSSENNLGVSSKSPKDDDDNRSEECISIDWIQAEEKERCWVIIDGSLFHVSTNLLINLELLLSSSPSSSSSPDISLNNNQRSSSNSNNNDNDNILIYDNDNGKNDEYQSSNNNSNSSNSSSGTYGTFEHQVHVNSDFFSWKQIINPSIYPLRKIFSHDCYIWVIDHVGNVFSSSSSSMMYHQRNKKSQHVEMTWTTHPSAPHNLQSLSIGDDNEVWGIDSQFSVYRRFIPNTSKSSSSSSLSPPSSPLISSSSSSNNNNNHDLIVNEKWQLVANTKLRSIAVESKEEVWGLDEHGAVYICRVNPTSRHLHPDRLTSPSSSSSKKRRNSVNSDQVVVVLWEPLGNAKRFHLLLKNRSAVYGLENTNDLLCYHNHSDQNNNNDNNIDNENDNNDTIREKSESSSKMSCISITDQRSIYRLSKHRLFVASSNSARKIWDDRKTNSSPYSLSIWRTIPPKGYSVFGHFAERSILEFPMSETMIVREVGKQLGEIDILVSPIGFKLMWSTSTEYGEISTWRPIPPSDDYVCIGEVSIPSVHGKPSLSSVKCIHKNFVTRSNPNFLGDRGYLWTSHKSDIQNKFSLWLVSPVENCIYCNSFISSIGVNVPPIPSFTNCLKSTTVNE